MLISTPSIYLLLRQLTATDTTDIESAGTTVQTESSQQISNENLIILKKIGKLFDVMMAQVISCTLFIVKSFSI